MTQNFTNQRALLELAIDAAHENVLVGGGPFGAVIIFPDGQRYTGVNRVTANSDPTAHAEVQAIRNACAARGDISLAGAILFSSCEPCPMCLGASMWARLDAVYYAADRHDAAAAGFDDAVFYELLAAGNFAKPVAVPTYLRPFNTWRAKQDRIDY